MRALLTSVSDLFSLVPPVRAQVLTRSALRAVENDFILPVVVHVEGVCQILAAGTWSIDVISRKDVSSGIITVSLSTDGASYTNVGSAPYNASGSTIDLYNGSTTYNNVSTITGITVATTGCYRLRLKVESKNASSNNYAAYLNGVGFRQTA